MKKFFIALAILFCVTGNVNAAPFTDNQFNKIFTDITKNPALENSATFGVNVETFKEKFNASAEPILKEITGLDDLSAMAHLFLIYDYKVFNLNGVDVFANTFGNKSVSVVGVTAPDGGNFKVLQCCYTTAEEQDDLFVTQMVLTAFVRSIAPDVEVPTLMGELTAENSSGTVTKGDVTFSVAEDGNLNVLTAVVK